MKWIESFATDYDDNKKDLEKYLISKGSKDKRPRDTDYIPYCSYPKDDILDGIILLGNDFYMNISGIGRIDKD